MPDEDSPVHDEEDPAQGERGKTGKAGVPGETGERGRTGDPGRVGDTGKTGDIGKTGEIGHTGMAGQAGAQGVSGEAGEAGEAGHTGAAGNVGAAGQPGKAGEAGQTGAAGARGKTGPPGDVGLKGPDGQATGEHQRAVIEATLKQVTRRSDRRLFVKAAVLGFGLALIVMIPATFVVGLELASVNDIERLAEQNARLIRQTCNTSRRHAEIEEQAAITQAAQNQALLKSGATFGLTKRQLAKAIKDGRERDALRIARLRALADTDCSAAARTTTTTKPKPQGQ